MADLLNSNMRAQIELARQDIFDTFKSRLPVRFYKTETKTVVINDPNFNADFDIINTDNITLTAVYSDFYVRIHFLQYQPLENSFAGDQNITAKAKNSWGRIRIQMEQDAFDYLKETERFVYNGYNWKINEDFREVRVFGTTKFYEIILEHAE